MPFTIGKKYNWIGQSERLVYLGHNWSGNGYWHQFAKVESPTVVWCEVLSSQLGQLEETTSFYPFKDWNINSCWKHNGDGCSYILTEKGESQAKFVRGDWVEIVLSKEDAERIMSPT